MGRQAFDAVLWREDREADDSGSYRDRVLLVVGRDVTLIALTTAAATILRQFRLEATDFVIHVDSFVVDLGGGCRYGGFRRLLSAPQHLVGCQGRGHVFV
jgi:hypothetical protein